MAYDQGPDEFEAARQRASQQVNAGVQTQKDALKRRFAAQGNLNSGIALKQDQLAEQAGAQNLQQANEGINAQQQGVLRQEREAQKGRDFAADQANIGRQFQSGEADKQRGFISNERYLQDQKEEHQAELSRGLASSQFAQSLGLEKEKFTEDKRVNDANIALQNKVLDQKDLFEQLLGPAVGGAGGLAGNLGKFLGGAGYYTGGGKGSREAVLGAAGAGFIL